MLVSEQYTYVRVNGQPDFISVRDMLSLVSRERNDIRAHARTHNLQIGKENISLLQWSFGGALREIAWM